MLRHVSAFFLWRGALFRRPVFQVVLVYSQTYGTDSMHWSIVRSVFYRMIFRIFPYLFLFHRPILNDVAENLCGCAFHHVYVNRIWNGETWNGIGCDVDDVARLTCGRYTFRHFIWKSFELIEDTKQYLPAVTIASASIIGR